MIIYHGSCEIVQKPKYGVGKSDNDYGSGFYTTENEEKANLWAYANSKDGKAYTNKYKIMPGTMYQLDLDTYGTLAWIAEIIANRGVRDSSTQLIAEKISEMYKVDTSKADIIIGYRADDSYIDVVDAFLKNKFTIDEVDRMFKEGHLGKQVFIKSPKAFDALEFIGYQKVDTEIYKNDFSENNARKKVAHNISERDKQIMLQGYTPQGITATAAIQNMYIYNSTYQYYEMKPLEIEIKKETIKT